METMETIINIFLLIVVYLVVATGLAIFVCKTCFVMRREGSYDRLGTHRRGD